MADFSDFDRYCEEHTIAPGDEPIAFAAWMHEISGGTFRICGLEFEHPGPHDFGLGEN